MSNPTFEEYFREVQRKIAKALTIPFEQLSRSFETAVKSQAAYLKMQQDISNGVREKWLLCRWVSGLDPIIWYDTFGNVIGVGTEWRIVLCWPGEEWRKTVTDMFPTARID